MGDDELIKQGRVKRLFRAKRKLTIPNLVSHVTQRAAGKEPLFLEDADYLFMLGTMKDLAKKRSLDIYAFCLMPNHVGGQRSEDRGRKSEIGGRLGGGRGAGASQEDELMR
jgi:hypothetical protein